MKVSRIAITLLGAALLCSASVFAAETKGTLNLDENVTVDGTPVKAGHYKVQWDGNGPDVQVTILKGKDTVATFPARVTDQPTPTYANAYGSTEQPNGARADCHLFWRQTLCVGNPT